MARRLCGWMVAACLVLACDASRAAQVHLNDKTFTLPDGFTIEQIAGPPLVNRPVTGDFDEQGRLYVTDSSGTSQDLQTQLKQLPHRVLRLQDTGGNGTFDRATVFADRMMFPEGTLWYGGSLYVSGVPSIWKLTDSTGNGVADQRSQWFAGKTVTGCGNDLHGPYLGPDGWIYWCKGAFAEQRYERPGKKPFVTRAAHIFRARADASGIEPVMTGGMDNPVEVVLTPGGERIFTTTFLQNPAGGKRDGIIHAVYGGIYGKVHDVIDDHPHTSPDVMPVLVHLGPAACCGLVRYESSTFGPEYRDNLFVSSFNLHKVTRHVLKPDGATFAATTQDFLVCDSLDFHPTHLIEDADGSLVVIDTGGWYKLCCPTSQIGKPDVLGAIYRVSRVGARAPRDPRGLGLAWDSMGPPELAKLLDDARPSVRKRAVAALAAQGAPALEALREVLQKSGSVEARVNAVWAATRIEGEPARAIDRLALDDADETVRQAAAHSASVRVDRGAVAALLRLLENPSPQNRRVAAEALGRLGDAGVVPAILTQIEKPNDRVLDHSLTYALIEIDDSRSVARGLNSPSARVRRSAMIALDQMEGGQIDPGAVGAELTSSDAALRETATWVAGRHPEWGEALAGILGRRIAAPDLAPDERLELQHELARLASSPPITRLLATQAQDSASPAAGRRLALAAMAQAHVKQPPPEWIEAISRVLGEGDVSLLPDAVAAAGTLPSNDKQSPQLGGPLLQVARQENLPAVVRLDALAAVPGRIHETGDKLFSFLLSELAPDQAPSLRLTASQVLARCVLTSGQLRALADAVKTAGPLEIDKLLGAFDQSSDETTGRALVAALTEAKSFKSLRPESLSPHLAKFGPAVQKEAQPLLARLSPNAAAQKARLEQVLASLPPGDARRGQLVFHSPKTACATCHAIGYVGGNVGPDLTRVGAVRSQRDLLESVLYPSASFVQSFQPMMVDTRSGDRQYGIVRADNADEVVLITGPNQEVHIRKQDVKEMRPGTVSLMPEGIDQQLSVQELADLLAFLGACK